MKVEYLTLEEHKAIAADLEIILAAKRRIVETLRSKTPYRTMGALCTLRGLDVFYDRVSITLDTEVLYRHGDDGYGIYRAWEPV